MEKLTQKEEEIMKLFWKNGPMFVRELLELYPEPRPHFNTVSTFVHLLEDKGYVSHEKIGNTHRYFAVIDENKYSNNSLSDVIRHCFKNSYLSAVSALVEEDKISVEELRELIRRVENQK